MRRWIIPAAIVMLLVLLVGLLIPFLKQNSKKVSRLAALLNALPELGLSPLRTIDRDVLYADGLLIGTVKLTRTSTNEPVPFLGGYLISAGFVSDYWALSVGALGDTPEADTLHAVAIILDARNVSELNRDRTTNNTMQEPLALTDSVALGRSCKTDLERLLPNPTSVSPGLGGREDWSYCLSTQDTWKWADLSFDRNGVLQTVSFVAKTLPSKRVP